MKIKLLFCALTLSAISNHVFGQNTWDATYGYKYDAPSTVLSNIVLRIDHSGAPTNGWDYNIYLVNTASSTSYTIYDVPGNGGLGGTNGTTLEPLLLPNIKLTTIKGLPAGNYILMGHASIVSGDQAFNTSSNPIKYSGTSGIEEEVGLVNGSLTTYPNPVKEFSNMRFELSKQSYVTLNIYDINGRLVLSPIQEKMTVGNHLISCDMSSFKTGMYFYRFTVDNQTKNGIFVKE